MSDGPLRAVAAHPLPLWIAFVLVHFVIGVLAFAYPDRVGVGDSVTVYPVWVEHGWATGRWVGIDEAWVYPILALPPMILGDLLGPTWAASMWLALVMVVDAVAFAFVTGFGRDRRAAALGWWWLAFLLLLGPIGLTRIDAWATAIAIIGALLVVSRPRVAGALLAVAAWIKVWPAAVAVAVVVAVRRRLDVLAAALIVTGVVVAGVLLLGGGANLFSFVAEQSGRGLQIESVLATPWMWWGAADPGAVSLYFDTGILTFQLRGPGVEAGAALATPLLVLGVGAVLLLGILAARRGVAAAELLPVMALGFTIALIVGNKVGSPQYAGWLAVPVLLGIGARMTGHGIPFRLPAIASLAIALLTQVIYPTFYTALLQLTPALILVLTVRNALYATLLVWSLARLVLLVRRPPARGQDGDWLPQVWPSRRISVGRGE
jgi:hypothetical protein